MSLRLIQHFSDRRMIFSIKFLTNHPNLPVRNFSFQPRIDNSTHTRRKITLNPWQFGERLNNNRNPRRTKKLQALQVLYWRDFSWSSSWNLRENYLPNQKSKRLDSSTNNQPSSQARPDWTFRLKTRYHEPQSDLRDKEVRNEC